MNRDVNVFPHEKRCRFYVGKGIPDPWGSSQYVHHIFSYPVGSEDISKLLKNRTHDSVRNYLFKCPDKCATNLECCSSQDNHIRNHIYNESHDKCNCERLFRNCRSDKKLHRGKNQYPKGGPGGELSSVNCSSDTEGEQLGNKFAGFCEYCEKNIECKCSGNEDPDKYFKFHKKGNIFKEEKICICPCMTNCCGRNKAEIGSQKLFLKAKVSKEIQTDNQKKCSKIVQTETSKPKSQPKCTCMTKCSCNGIWVKRDCSEVNSYSNFCCCLNYNQNQYCPYSFSNHCTAQKPCKCKKKMLKHPKKQKQFNKYDYDDEQEMKLQTDQEAPRAEVEYYTLRHKVKQNLEEHEPAERQDLRFGQSISNIKNPPKTSDYLKYLSDYKLRSQLQEMDISPNILKQKLQSSVNITDFYKRYPLLFTLRHKGDLIDKFKYVDCKPGNAESPFTLNKIDLEQNDLYALGIRKHNPFNEAAKLPEKQTRNVLNKEKGIQSEIRSTESEHSGFIKNQKINTQKHKKLRLRKRRKKSTVCKKVNA